jgi:hypothetical protein
MSAGIVGVVKVDVIAKNLTAHWMVGGTVRYASDPYRNRALLKRPEGPQPTAHHSKSRSFETRRSVPLISIPLLILFTETLDVRFAVRIEEFLAAFLPRRFEFGCCDVPVWSAFFSNSA